jgi:hypothetical protein
MTALLIAASLTATSACGIIGNPLAGKAGPSTAASASAQPSASPSPVPVELAAGQCFNDYYTDQIVRTSVHLVDCTAQHFGETVYVGRFVGVAAEGEPPGRMTGFETGAAAKVQSDAYLDCSTHADTYLGHSWIHRLLTLRITVPLSTAWSAGERWYRCDLFQTSTIADGAIVPRTGGLKGFAFGPVCVNQNKSGTPIVDCKTKHPGEFVGGFLMPAGLKKAPETEKETDPYAKKCWKIMAPYLGVATSRAQYLVGVSFQYEYNFGYWDSGRRVAWCYTWTGKSSSSYVTGSAKGRKGKGL